MKFRDAILELEGKKPIIEGITFLFKSEWIRGNRFLRVTLGSPFELEILRYFMSWRDTPQGPDYWLEVFEKNLPCTESDLTFFLANYKYEVCHGS